MFDPSNSYKFNCICRRKKSQEKPVLFSWIYSFKTRFKRRYIVLIEEYPNKVLVVKFYLKQFKESEDKYNVVIDDGDMFRIVSTVIKILLRILEIDPEVSFGFIGAHKVKEDFIEEKSNCTRYRIYQRIIKNYFGYENYKHAWDENNSAYLLINKGNPNKNTTKDTIELFTEYYPDLVL